MNQYVTGAVIKRLREEKNMTQQQLADKLSVSAKTISKWETAKGYPDITLLESIANALSVSVTELISGNTIVTLSAFEWEKDRKTLIYGQVDYMYGEALYKPEMKEEYHILICKMRLGKPVQANGCLSYRDLGIWQEHLFLRIMPKFVILSSQHREAETVGGLPSRRRVFSHDYIFRIVSILFIARRCHQSGNSDWT